MGGLRLRLRALLRRGAVERELDEELRYHVEQQVDEYVREGMPRAEARRRVLSEFGGVERLKEECRDARGVRLFEDLAQDLVYCARTLRKSPAFAAGAVLSLALGIGANTAIFHLLDVVLLRPLPVERPQELAEIRIADLTGARGSFMSWHQSLTNPVWEQVRDRQRAFSGVFAWGADSFDLSSGGESRSARGLWVSGDFFDVLGVRPAAGRLLTREDDRRGSGAAVAVISYAFWQRELGGDRAAVGKTLVLDNHPCEIVGVAPAGFTGLEIGRAFDVAVPVAAQDALRGEDSLLDSGVAWWLTVMGRLAPGVSVEQASAELGSISPGVFEASLSPTYPRESVDTYLGFRLEAAPAGTGISQLRETYESPLQLLLAVAGLVLLIACANLANLMLARANAREREVAVRLALGASRGRVVRQLLSESLTLSAVGALLGALLAQALSRALVALISTAEDPLFVDLGVDWRVLAFTAGVAVATCLLFGLTPAVRAARTSPESVLRAGGRGTTGGGERSRLRRALVVSQVALSLVLVIGAFLFSRSLGRLIRGDTGLRQDGVLVAGVDMSRLNTPADRRLALQRAVLERVRSAPGVDAVASAGIVPLSGNQWSNDVWMDGGDSSRRESSMINRVSPGYFETLEIPLLAGRDFDDRDTAGSPRVAVVNETFARRLVGDANPVGRRFWVQATPSTPETAYEIVGLVRDAKYADLREDFKPVAFLAASQNPRPGQFVQLLVHSAGPTAETSAAVRSALAQVDPAVVVDLEVFSDKVRGSILSDRLLATLSAFFGVLALVLACAGLYGILSYGVVSRTAEIGVRLALGARRADVVWIVVREALLLVVAGVAIGLPVALLLGRFVSSLLFGVAPADPASLCLAAAAMALVAAAAGYIPARRASGVDPMVALRYE